MSKSEQMENVSVPKADANDFNKPKAENDAQKTESNGSDNSKQNASEMNNKEKNDSDDSSNKSDASGGDSFDKSSLSDDSGSSSGLGDKLKSGISSASDKFGDSLDETDAVKNVGEGDGAKGEQNTAKAIAEQEKIMDGNKKKSPLKKAAMAKGGLAGGLLAAKAAATATMLMILKTILAAIQAMGAAVASFISAIVATVVQIATAVATAIGVSVITAAFGLFGLFVIGAVIVVGAVVSNVELNNAQREGAAVEDCFEVVAQYEQDPSASASATENAKKVYAVFHEYGLSDEQIAGALGSFNVESGVNFRRIESDYTRSVKNIIDAHNLFTTNHISTDTLNALREAVIRSYDGSGISLNIDFYMTGTPGLGIGQLTGSRGLRLLEWSNEAKMNWATPEAQLAQMIAPEENGGDTRSNWIKNTYSQKSYGTPEEAAYDWAADWEGNTSLGMDKRKSYAASWFAAMADWQADASYANSIIEKAGAVKVSGVNSMASNAKDKCAKAKQFDNSSAAAAAVSYAYPTKPEGENNKGTDLYQEVHKAIHPGDSYWQSCDRSVIYAVKWSGTDDNISLGGVSNIDSYLRNSDKWENVTESISSWDDCQPGDLLLTKSNSHITMYVGAELIWQIHGDELSSRFSSMEEMKAANYNNVSGSIYWNTHWDLDGDEGNGDNSRSPGCGYPDNNIGEINVWRNVQKESNPKYTTVVDGYNFSLASTNADGTVNMTIYTNGPSFRWPLNGSYSITSPFGLRDPIVTDNGAVSSTQHTGIDIGAPTGTPILAAADGTVTTATISDVGYGNHVIIAHGDGYETLYAHASSLNVEVGEKVSKGDVIAYVGATGNSKGAHLHFEVHYNGGYYDPEKFSLKK